MWESENQDESPLMTTDNFHGIDRLVPTTGGGSKPEPELDLLSNVIKTFNDKLVESIGATLIALVE